MVRHTVFVSLFGHIYACEKCGGSPYTLFHYVYILSYIFPTKTHLYTNQNSNSPIRLPRSIPTNETSEPQQFPRSIATKNNETHVRIKSGKGGDGTDEYGTVERVGGKSWW